MSASRYLVEERPVSEDSKQDSECMLLEVSRVDGVQGSDQTSME